MPPSPPQRMIDGEARRERAVTPLPARTMRKTTRTTDSKGRLTLGAEYAFEQFLIYHLEDDTIQMIPAKTVPAREAWLYENPKALASVRKGLEQARAGHRSKGPDLDAAIAFAEKIKD